eukprot:g13670.t1
MAMSFSTPDISSFDPGAAPHSFPPWRLHLERQVDLRATRFTALPVAADLVRQANKNASNTLTPEQFVGHLQAAVASPRSAAGGGLAGMGIVAAAASSPPLGSTSAGGGGEPVLAQALLKQIDDLNAEKHHIQELHFETDERVRQLEQDLQSYLTKLYKTEDELGKKNRDVDALTKRSHALTRENLKLREVVQKLQREAVQGGAAGEKSRRDRDAEQGSRGRGGEDEQAETTTGAANANASNSSASRVQAGEAEGLATRPRDDEDAKAAQFREARDRELQMLQNIERAFPQTQVREKESRLNFEPEQRKSSAPEKDVKVEDAEAQKSQPRPPSGAQGDGGQLEKRRQGGGEEGPPPVAVQAPAPPAMQDNDDESKGAAVPATDVDERNKPKSPAEESDDGELGYVAVPPQRVKRQKRLCQERLTCLDCCVLPDGDPLALLAIGTGGPQPQVLLLDAESGQPLGPPQDVSAVVGGVAAVSISPDRRLVLVSGSGKTVHLYSLHESEESGEFFMVPESAVPADPTEEISDDGGKSCPLDATQSVTEHARFLSGVGATAHRDRGKQLGVGAPPALKKNEEHSDGPARLEYVCASIDKSGRLVMHSIEYDEQSHLQHRVSRGAAVVASSTKMKNLNLPPISCFSEVVLSKNVVTPSTGHNDQHFDTPPRTTHLVCCGSVDGCVSLLSISSRRPRMPVKLLQN